jgi:hypothetical protein
MAKKGNSNNNRSAPAKSSAPAKASAPSNSGGGGGARAAATAAASTGSFTAANAQALRQAGVSPAKIQDLRQASQAVASRNNTAATARAAMDPTVASAMQAQANQGLAIGQQFYDSPGFQQALGTTGLTPQQIAEYAKTQGYGLGNQFMEQFGTSSTPRTITNDTKFREAMKIFAAQGRGTNLIGGREQKQLMKQFSNKTGLNFARSVDKINANNADMMPIGLTGGVLNRLNRNKDGSLGNMRFGEGGEGFLGILQNMNDRRSPMIKGQGGQITPGTGKFRRGDTIYGLMSDGSFRQTPGVGKGWADTRFGQPVTSQYEPFYTPTGDTGPGAVPGDGGDIPPPPEPPETPDANQTGAGADLASFAVGWKSARGSRARAGRKAQGTGSMRIAPSYGAGVGTNYG